MKWQVWAGIFIGCLGFQTHLQGQDQLALFGGAGGGYTHIIPKSGAGTSKNGYHLFLHAFGEWTEPSWVFQGGGGFFYNRVYSDGEKTFEGSQASTVREQRNLRIETRSGGLALAARYRLGLGLEGGLLLQSLFGSSLSFSQDKTSRSTKFFLGPQAVLRLGELAGYQQRIDLSLTMSLNVPDKKVYLLTAGYAIGTPVSPAPSPASDPAPEDRFEEVFADKVINFPTSSSTVQGPALGFLEDLGAFLKQEGALWQKIEVEGHTDKKGKASYNLKLSEQRANAVRTVLVGKGVPADKVTAKGYGPYRPLAEGDSPEALATNRRVVMIFSVAKREDRQRISAQIKELRHKYFGE